MPAEPDGLPDSDGPSQRLRSQRLRSTKAWAARGVVVIMPIVLTACQPAVLDPQGHHRDCRQDDPDRLARHHAGDRRPDDRRDAWLRLVVPRLQHQGALSAGLGLFRPHRADRLGDPAAGHHAPGRRGLDRIARARSRQAAGVEARRRSRSRSSRSTGNGCSSIPNQRRRQRQPAGRSRRRAACISR